MLEDYDGVICTLMTSCRWCRNISWKRKRSFEVWTMKDMETMLWTKQRMRTWLDDDMEKTNKEKDNDMKNTHVDIARQWRTWNWMEKVTRKAWIQGHGRQTWQVLIWKRQWQMTSIDDMDKRQMNGSMLEKYPTWTW